MAHQDPGSERDSGYRARLADRLAESLLGSLPGGTPRRVHGRVLFAGKATAVIGMRRAGETTHLHRLRREEKEALGEAEAIRQLEAPARELGAGKPAPKGQGGRA